MNELTAIETAYRNGFIDGSTPKGECKIAFDIPYPSTKSGKAEWNKDFGMNAYYAGKHWAKRRKDAEYWHSLTRHYLTKKEMLTKPVIIRYFFNDRLDISNHSVMCKMIEDALKGIVIEDDSKKYVVGQEIYFHEKDFIRIELREVTE